jgi:hypothetical protein
MTDHDHEDRAPADWRSDAEGDNPAGSFFAGGDYAEADIVSDAARMTHSTITGCCNC